MKDLRSSRMAVAALVLGFCGLEAVRTARGDADGQDREELSASADVGRVLDREGVAARRGVLADRWGPVEEGTSLEAGDCSPGGFFLTTDGFPDRSLTWPAYRRC